MKPASLARYRDGVLRRIDGLDNASSLVVGLSCRAALRLGADARIIDEACRPDLPLNRSLQIVQWALAATGWGRFPRHFSPGDHLISPESRLVATELIRSVESPSPEVTRQLVGLDDASGLTATLDLIDRDLREAIGVRSITPKRGPGIDSDLQSAVVADAVAALEAAGLRPFAMSGSLLGLIRDGRFMPHDYDIDLGLLPEDDLGCAYAAMADVSSFEVEIEGPRIVARHDSDVIVDVFAHELRDDRLWHATRVHEWWNTPFGLERRSFNGVDLWIPSDPERYLDENYGDWRHPVPFYDISFDTPNRRYIKDLDAARFLHSRCIQALQRGDRWLLESAVRELRDTFGVDVSGLLAESPLITAHD